MGDPFLRTYYSIYDMENNRIGLVGIAETERIKMQTLASRMNDKIDKILEKIGIDEQNEFVLEILGGILAMILCLCICCCL